MKKIFTYVISASFVFGILVLLNELVNCLKVIGQIDRKEAFLPTTSKTFQMASDNAEFANSQYKALLRRIHNIPGDIIKHICVVLVSLLILSQSIKVKAQKAVSSIVEIFPKIGNSSRMKEVCFVSFTITSIIAAVFAGGPIIFKPLKAESQFFISITVYLALGFVFIPFVYVIARKLLKVYSSRLIAACYLAYYVKSISEFLTVEDVNMQTMKKLDISVFSNTVVDYLKERHLENRIYGERKKSETLNAALVGWGTLERIEIYGNHKNLTDKEFEAVLMHEIGHSQDYSLFKKLSALFILKFIEMVIVLQLYLTVSEEYSDEFISKYGVFSIILILYFLFIDRWLLLFHKLTSQAAENSADLIAKAHGYGQDLAKVLFDITIRGETNIQSTKVFNALRSYHPTVYDRIEKLKS